MSASWAAREVVRMAELIEALQARVARLEKVIVNGAVITSQVCADEIFVRDLTVEHPDTAELQGPHARITAHSDWVEMILRTGGDDDVSVGLNATSVENPDAGVTWSRHGNTLALFNVYDQGSCRTGSHVSLHMAEPDGTYGITVGEDRF